MPWHARRIGYDITVFLHRSLSVYADQGIWFRKVGAGYFTYHAVPTDTAGVRHRFLGFTRVGNLRLPKLQFRQPGSIRRQPNGSCAYQASCSLQFNSAAPAVAQPPYVPSVLPRCRLRSIWYRVYRTAGSSSAVRYTRYQIDDRRHHRDIERTYGGWRLPYGVSEQCPPALPSVPRSDECRSPTKRPLSSPSSRP